MTEERDLKRRTILVFAGYYIPGYRSGGAVRTVANIVERLSEYYDFKIIAYNHDYGCSNKYMNIKTNEWNSVNGMEVFYTDNKYPIRKVINDTVFDLYYLGGFFSFNFSIKIILLRYLKFIPFKKIIIPARGDLGKGALSFKVLKKKIYINLSKALGLYRDVEWQASSENEAYQIRSIFGEDSKIKTVMDLPDFKLMEADISGKKEKKSGLLRILYLSVVHPIKNVKFMLEVLNNVQGDYVFDMYGTIKDKKYWDECMGYIENNGLKNVNYFGIAEHEDIESIFRNYDLFVLPTLGENFGHAIYESLALGCPVLTTNNVIWTGLEENKTGWNYDLDDKGKFVDLIEKLIKCDGEEYKAMTGNCRGYLMGKINEEELVKKNIELIES